MGQEDEIKDLLANIDEMVLYFRTDGQIKFANAAAKRLLGYGEDLIQHNMEEIFPIVESPEEALKRYFHNSKNMPCFLEAYRENKTCFQVSAKFFPVREQVYLCIATDITEDSMLQRQMDHVQQEAMEAEKVKTEFVANITHELRTPVNGILGNILELKEVETDPKKNRIISLVERGCADMNAIINNILDFSKLESGKFTIEKREFDFGEMMQYVESIHRPKLTDKGLDFSINIAPDVPKIIVGDELRIVQVLNNLLSNAAKFTNVGRVGVEVIKTAQTRQRIELFFIVIDTGIGISKVNQDKLFQSFTQVDASISRRFGGTGLGLNISKQLVELMDGHIHIESDEGKGSMFSFHIWVDIPESMQETGEGAADTFLSGNGLLGSFEPSLSDYMEDHQVVSIRTFGTEQNRSEIERSLNKLILSVEMENWEKAETFANSVRELTEEAPKEMKNKALRLKMAVQKEDYQKASVAVDEMRQLLEG